MFVHVQSSIYQIDTSLFAVFPLRASRSSILLRESLTRPLPLVAVLEDSYNDRAASRRGDFPFISFRIRRTAVHCRTFFIVLGAAFEPPTTYNIMYTCYLCVAKSVKMGTLSLFSRHWLIGGGRPFVA